jgi:hypothetical protein
LRKQFPKITMQVMVAPTEEMVAGVLVGASIWPW